MWTAQQLFDGEQLGLERDPAEVPNEEEEGFLEDDEIEEEEDSDELEVEDEDEDDEDDDFDDEEE